MRRPPIVSAAVVVVATFTLPTRAQGSLENGLSLTPPMGWNTWNSFGGGNETIVTGHADAMATNGMRDVGYSLVVIDEGWALSRNPDGTININTTLFPSGIAALSDYIRSQGLQFGIYTSRGETACGGAPGSSGWEQEDADLYASLNVDYVKADGCGANLHEPDVLQRALLNCGRPIILGVNAWGYHDGWDTVCNNWGSNGTDIQANWASISSIIEQNEPLWPLARPGHWNNPDMLEVGNGSLTLEENRTHFTMWCMLAAPLFAGNDLRSMSAAVRDILTDTALIAVNQDSLGKQGRCVWKSTDRMQSVWAKPMRDSSCAVVLLNRGTDVVDVSMGLHVLGQGWRAGMVCPTRDLWAETSAGPVTDSYTAHVPPHGAVALRVSRGPDQAAPRLQTAYNDTTLSRVLVVFDEPVLLSSAEQESNYSLNNGATVSTARLLADSQTVALTTSTLLAGTQYALRVEGISDRAVPHNAMAASASVEFTAQVHSVHKLSGAAFGSGDPFGGSATVTYAAAVDGDIATYADLDGGVTVPSGFMRQGYGYLYVGYDMGAVQAVVTRVAYAPRSGQQARMVGMTVEGSNDRGATWGWTPYCTVSVVPPAGVLTQQTAAAGERAFRYIRLEGTRGYLNIAEIEFYGYEVAGGTVATAPAPRVRAAASAVTSTRVAVGLTRRTAVSGATYDLRGARLSARRQSAAPVMGAYVVTAQTPK